jgi:tetratricopeptide (TPR) repeat protein
MSQRDLKSETSLSTSQVQNAGTDSTGLPRTPYGVATFILTAVISVYSWLFKLWDDSEFPETFAHPGYWLLLGLILLIGGLWAFFVWKRSSWLDFVMVEVLFLAAAVMFVLSVYVYREAQPSEKVFTVALFKFSDHTTTKDVGLSFRDNIQRELEVKYGDQILVLARDREIKGETPEERVSYASAWGSRSSGCHLAVWAEIFMDKDGQNYVVNLHWTRVFPFGTQSNHEDVESFDRLNLSFVAKSAGGKGAVDENGISSTVNTIVFLYGIATYDRAAYDLALKILSPLRNVWSEFFAGKTAYKKTERSTQTLQLLSEAEAHFLEAIRLDNDHVLRGLGYAALGKTHHARVSLRLTGTPKHDAESAIVAYAKAAEIMKERGELSNYSFMLLQQANMLLAISALEESALAKRKIVDEAEGKIREAMNNIEPNSEDYSEAHSILANVYYRRGEYEKAMGAYETALLSAKLQANVANYLTSLGQAQTRHAWRIRDRKLHEKGLGNFRRASEICQAISVPFECYLAHMNAGVASFNWADKLIAGSLEWITEMEIAIKEFELCGEFVSKTEQAPLYAECKRLTALANTTRASTEKSDERLRFLKAGLYALTEGIEALSVAGFDRRQFYIERARCYDTLRFSSTDSRSKQEYLRLAKIDRDAATIEP